MVELQSCLNASALCAIEQEMKGENVNIIAEISAELHRERQKNADLMERISTLEAQIHEKDKDSLVPDGQGSYLPAVAKKFKKFKRRKIKKISDEIENGDIIKSVMAIENNHDSGCMGPEEINAAGHLVNWMSMDDIQVLHLENLKDNDCVADFDDTDDSDDEYDDTYDDDDMNNAHKDGELNEIPKTVSELKDQLPEGINEGSCILYIESNSSVQSETIANLRQEMHEDQKNSCILPHAPNERELNIHEKKEINTTRGYEASLEVPTIGKEIFTAGSGSTSLHKRPLKVAFCPKEVKRIIESEALLQKNAQSHTIRKIIVFASLGIRHGCEDMYELDFNHFSILKKGEPYMSPNNPGEHVLYENPGVRRKIFYPNQQNQKLCPVQILEEEKAMRPSDASCPSCLFLCIKYGGRTRNLPQNEYVRQRMGRNKLKSFGPLMCRMAMLVHIRSGSFFFKALGITLLFMAGFPDDLVQRETKYRNLDLLQKYYRTDEDAEGEELFLPHPIPCDTQISPEPHHVIRKSISNKTRGRKHTNSISKSPNLARPLVEQSTPSSSTPPTQFGLTGYPSIDTHAMATFQPVHSQVLTDAPQMSNPVLANSGTQVSHNHNLYHMFQPRPANAFMPMMYWPPPTAFPPAPYPSTYGYQSFPSTGNYISFHPWPYYGHPSCSSSIPNLLEGSGKNKVTGEETVSESDNSSSSSKQKQKPATCK